MSLMKAVRIYAYGGPEVLTYEDAPRPEPAQGEVLIRVHATSVNPFDLALRAGYLASYFNLSFPAILGADVAGTVEQIGAGVSSVSPGDRVYTRADLSGNGAYADYTVVPAADVAAMPVTLDFIHAAALPHVTLTAWQALIVGADLAAGQTVLIHGAAGGVGHIAVQLARWRGAKVIGTASVNLPFLHELGVDQAIDYTATPFEDLVRDVDVVLDTIGGETQQRSWSVLKPGGVLVSVVHPPSEEAAAAHGGRTFFVSTNPPIGPTLTAVAALADEGVIRPAVSRILPLSEIRQAHELIQLRHTRGKLVLEVAE